MFISSFLFVFQVDAHLGSHEELSFLRKELKKHPNRVSLYFLRSGVYRRHKEFGKALKDLQKIRELSPASPKLDLYFAWTWFASGDMGKSNHALFRYKLCGKTHWMGWLLEAKMREKEHRWKEAIFAYDQVIASSSSVTPALYLSRGRLQERMGHWKIALREYLKASRRLKHPIVLQMAVLRIFDKQRLFQRSLLLINQILSRLSVKSDWWLRRADLYVKLNQLSLARHDRFRALQESRMMCKLRRSAFNELRLARVLWALGRRKKAKGLVLSVGKRFPTLPEVLTLVKRFNIHAKQLQSK